jgi:phage shock protein A
MAGPSNGIGVGSIAAWRARRAIARLTTRARNLQDEVDQLRAELGPVEAEADDATIQAAVRDAAPVAREARRARADRDNLRRLLADRRASLDDVLARRDQLLDDLADDLS